MNLSKAKRKAKNAGIVGLFGLLGIAQVALAVTTKNTGLDESGQTIYGGAGPTKDLTVIIGTLLNGFLSLLGVVFVSLMIYSGVIWMTAAGSQEKIKKAQQTMAGAVIGFMLIMGAWSVSDFIVSAVVNVTSPSQNASQAPSP